MCCQWLCQVFSGVKGLLCGDCYLTRLNAAAHIIIISLFVYLGDQCSFRLRKIGGIIGSFTFVDAWVVYVQLISDST